MQVQDVSVTQIVIVLLFLGVLIVLQQLLKNNKFRIVNRSTISISSERKNIDFGESSFALNEITINRKDTTS